MKAAATITFPDYADLMARIVAEAEARGREKAREPEERQRPEPVETREGR